MKNSRDIDISKISTLIFAGGGNRCWWQAGLMSHLLSEGWQLPKHLVGTSAGAAMAAACITDGPAAALDACVHLFAKNKRIFNWHGLMQLKLTFAHQYTYPAWIDTFINAGNFTSICNSNIKLSVAVTRPSKYLGVAGSVTLGMLAYIIDKHIWHSIHPRLPRYLGLKQDFFDIHKCDSILTAQALLNAASAAPPFLPAISFNQQMAIDGGFFDNVPIPPLVTGKKSKVLILLTRHYPHLPQLFSSNEFVYFQPSKPVPVSTWDCTGNANIKKAYLLGEQDAAFLI